MVSSWSNERTGIHYPSLRTILSDKDESLDRHARALEHLTRKAFAMQHQLLTSEERRCRLDLWRLINLTRQLDLLDDLDAFTIGARCPEQLRSYDRSLKKAIRLAYRRGIETEALVLAEKAHERLWQVTIAVTQFYEGLS